VHNLKDVQRLINATDKIIKSGILNKRIKN
jgi:hypothetical protein